jgi:hypothetical protein
MASPFPYCQRLIAKTRSSEIGTEHWFTGNAGGIVHPVIAASVVCVFHDLRGVQKH